MEQTSVTWPKYAEIVVLLHEADGNRVSGQPFARHAFPGIQSDKYLRLAVRSPHPSVHRNTNRWTWECCVRLPARASALVQPHFCAQLNAGGRAETKQPWGREQCGLPNGTGFAVLGQDVGDALRSPWASPMCFKVTFTNKKNERLIVGCNRDGKQSVAPWKVL